MLPDKIDWEQSGHVLKVRIGLAELSHEQMQELINECLERVRMHNTTYILFDMYGVEFLASACLGPLVELVQDLEHIRGRVALVNCHDNVSFLMKVTRLDRVFGLYETEDAAMASL